MQDIRYVINRPISSQEFKEVLQLSGLGERRPIDDDECLDGMLKNSNLLVTAWQKEKLVGVARSITDFNYACYLSDLAVDQAYQKLGIGKMLVQQTQGELGKRCKILLFAAPNADAYYARIGFERNTNGWVLTKDKTVIR